MTPDLLTRVGTALYGTRWQTDLAAALDVNHRTIRRWAAGSLDPRDPARLRAELRALLIARGGELDRLAAELRG